jgi:PII-like signaling protein
MQTEETKVKLRIYIGESDTWKGENLYSAIVKKAKEMKLAGATVFRGIMGFGATSHIHSTKILRLSEDLPVLIEIVDTRENIDRFMPFVEEVVSQGMVTHEKINVKIYRSGKDH